MKLLKKNSIAKALIVSFVLAASGLTASLPAIAATTPSLGLAASYAILGNTYTNTSAGTTVNGDIGFTTGPAVVPAGIHGHYGPGSPYSTAGTDQGSALTALASQVCTFTFAPGAIDLSTDNTHGPVGVYTPGVYCSTGAMNVGGPITLNGGGTYIFRPVGALTSAPGAVVTLAGGSSCDVFWTPTQAATIAANNTFVGTIIDDSGITINANTTWTGRALAFGGTVTTNTDTISTPPGCSAAPATINVVKVVVNDSGGTNAISDFPLFVSGTPVVSGATNVFSPGAYTITETSNLSRYARVFSGDCDASGALTLGLNQNLVCIVTNNDILDAGAGGIPPPVAPPVPPLIDVVKVPSPLALPNGPGQVTYTYTARNIGTVPMSNVSLVGDTCSPITLISGDTNGDAILDVNETWVYTCSTTLAATHTNTVVATGWSNGISAVDIASATVIVGIPLVPPLIHVTKIPNPLTLMAGGGMVTYTERITNPGTVPLSNVVLNDDKCSPVNYVSGDTNGNVLLDPSETWTYSCQTNLTQTTTNTATAQGTANGITVRDFAIATVVVGAVIPTFPNTGVSPSNGTTQWSIAIAAGILLALFIVYIIAIRKKRTV